MEGKEYGKLYLLEIFDELFDTIDDHAYCAAVNANKHVKFLKKIERKEIAKNKLDELIKKHTY